MEGNEVDWNGCVIAADAVVVFDWWTISDGDGVVDDNVGGDDCNSGDNNGGDDCNCNCIDGYNGDDCGDNFGGDDGGGTGDDDCNCSDGYNGDDCGDNFGNDDGGIGGDDCNCSDDGDGYNGDGGDNGNQLPDFFLLFLIENAAQKRWNRCDLHVYEQTTSIYELMCMHFLNILIS